MIIQVIIYDISYIIEIDINILSTFISVTRTINNHCLLNEINDEYDSKCNKKVAYGISSASPFRILLAIN